MAFHFFVSQCTQPVTPGVNQKASLISLGYFRLSLLSTSANWVGLNYKALLPSYLYSLPPDCTSGMDNLSLWYGLLGGVPLHITGPLNPPGHTPLASLPDRKSVLHPADPPPILLHAAPSNVVRCMPAGSLTQPRYDTHIAHHHAGSQGWRAWQDA